MAHGNAVIETTHVIITPIAVAIPKFWIGGMSIKYKEINPIAVVRDVKKVVLPIFFMVFLSA